MTVDGHQRKAMKDRVPTVSKRRLNVHIRELTPADMRSVQHAIAIHWNRLSQRFRATGMPFEALVGISTVSSIGQHPGRASVRGS